MAYAADINLYIEMRDHPFRVLLTAPQWLRTGIDSQGQAWLTWDRECHTHPMN